jgi:carbon starvation protein
MFGVANQLLAVIALAIVTAVLAGEGKTKFLWVTLVPMTFVLTTTSSAAFELLLVHYNTITTQVALGASRNATTLTNSLMAVAAIALIFVCGGIVIAMSMYKTFFGTADETEPAVNIVPAE